jgi:hypothetical protein
MSDASVLKARPRPALFDIFLVVLGPVILAVGEYMFIGSSSFLVPAFVIGCIIGAAAWWWPRLMGPVMLVLSIPALAYSLFLTLYTGGMPYTLVLLWGTLAFLIGGVGVFRWRSAARRPMRHIGIQASLVGSIAVVFLLYIVILWPPQGKTILINLPIVKQATAPQVRLEARGFWSACWAPERVSVPEVLENTKNLLETDDWTIVDTALNNPDFPLMISAQRGAYSLEVLYDTDPSTHYCSTGTESGAFMAAYVRRGQARHFP